MRTSRGPSLPITNILVTGYKSIRNGQAIDIKPLTLLAGANSSGKSSMMQPLLLLKQTIDASFDPGPLLIDGPNVKFLSIDQMLSTLPNGKHVNSFSIGIAYDGFGLATRFAKKSGRKLDVEETWFAVGEHQITLRPRMTHNELVAALAKLIPDFSNIPEEYELSVRRNRCLLEVVRKRKADGFTWEDPTTVSPYLFAEESIHRLIHLPGLRGNPARVYPKTATGPAYPGTLEPYTASIIAQWQTNKDTDNLSQLSEYLKKLGLTQKISVKALNDTQLELQIGRSMNAGSAASEMINIADAGFGVSQVLPILVALIAAEPGQMVYIEQPEIHLHPRAQSIMAEILADAANRGVIVVAETHSDLLLLGVQTLVAQGKLPADKVILHWFQRDKDGSTRIDTATLDESGSFGDWPEDFGQVALDAESRYLDAAEAAQQKGK